MAKDYPNLPGVNINIEDGNLTTTTTRSANSVLIIANAVTNKEVPEGPVYVSNQQDLYDTFGGFFHMGQINPIAAQWLVAYRAGVTNIYLMALKGDDKEAQFIDLYKKLYDTVADLQVSHIVLDGLYADDDIAGLTKEAFTEAGVTDVALPTYQVFTAATAPSTIVEDEVGGEFAKLTITPKSGEPAITVSLPAGEVDINSINTQIKEALQINSLHLDGEARLNEGNVELTFTAPVTLAGENALSALGLTAAVANEEISGSPASLLANYVEGVSEELGGTLGYIGTSTPASYDLVGLKKHVDKLLAVDTQISPYLQIVAGPELGITVPGSLRRQWISGVTHYAVLVNSLLPQFAPTNQPLLGNTQMRYAFSPRQQNALVGHKYVCYSNKNQQIRVVDGVTTAPDLAIGEDTIKSDFTRISTIRIVNYMIQRMRYALEPFIGAPNEFYNYNGMNTAIRAELDDAVERGVIQDATYTIRLGSSLDTAEVDLQILPQFELRVIDVTVALARPEGFINVSE